MQVTVEKSTALERKLTVQVPGAALQQQIESRLRELGKQVKIRGFRPGRIPMNVLQQRYGKSVQQEVMMQAMQTSLQEAIEQESLRPASSPVIVDEPSMPPGGDLEYTASIEVFPEIPSIDASTIEIGRPDAEVSEQDIDEMIVTLQRQRQTWTDLERPAAKDEQVVIEYVAHLGEERVPEKGKHRVHIAIGHSGFEALESAVGKLAPGEDTRLELTFPEGYREARLAGQKADVEVSVIKVQQASLPEVDEAFIQSFGIESGSLDDLRSEVRSNLERELKQATTSYLKVQLVDRLLDMHADLEVPEALARDEAVHLYQRGAGQDAPQPSREQLQPLMELARRRVKSGLLLGELARQNHIMVDGARVRKAIESVAETYEQPQEVVRLYYSEQNLLKSVENTVLEEQVVDWVLDHARVKEQAMSMNDVITAASRGGQPA